MLFKRLLQVVLGLKLANIRCNEKRRRKKSFFFFVAQRQGLSSPLWAGRGWCFSERLDGFTAAGGRSREPTADRRATHSQTIRRLWFKPSLRQRKRERKSAPSRWRRDRDLNPGRHHCLTRFRIVRVQPLRHLCIDGRRAPEMQTSFYRKSAKKATDFACFARFFLCNIHSPLKGKTSFSTSERASSAIVQRR